MTSPCTGPAQPPGEHEGHGKGGFVAVHSARNHPRQRRLTPQEGVSPSRPTLQLPGDRLREGLALCSTVKTAQKERRHLHDAPSHLGCRCARAPWHSRHRCRSGCRRRKSPPVVYVVPAPPTVRYYTAPSDRTYYVPPAAVLARLPLLPPYADADEEVVVVRPRVRAWALTLLERPRLRRPMVGAPPAREAVLAESCCDRRRHHGDRYGRQGRRSRGERERMVEAIERQALAIGGGADYATLDARVLEALRQVPRHAFVSASASHLAYADRPLDIGLRQSISQPFVVALMTHLLQVQPGDRVLEIGTGSGYQAAVLARARARGLFDRDPGRARHQRRPRRWRVSGYANVAVRSATAITDGRSTRPTTGSSSPPRRTTFRRRCWPSSSRAGGLSYPSGRSTLACRRRISW